MMKEALTDIEVKIICLENAIWEYWTALPEPKENFSHWYYGDGGIYDHIEKIRKEVAA